MQDQQDWMDPNRPVWNTEDSKTEDIPEDAMDNVVYRKGSDIGQKGGVAGRDRKVDANGAYYDLDELDIDSTDDIMDSDKDDE